MTNPKDRKFYEYLREERQFSFLLAHLLMQKGPALARFFELIRQHPGGDTFPGGPLKLGDAEVYVEFAILRDQWDSLLRDEGPDAAARSRANVSKRAFITQKFQRVESLNFLAAGLPSNTEEFNAYFMGEAGQRITKDIASPGIWSVKSLASQAAQSGWKPEVFLDLCRLKWSFNIKPDIVVCVRGLPTVCIEAKLESGEGSYPTAKEEIELVERACGIGKRVRQFELQQFLFSKMLGEPCAPVVVKKHHLPNDPQTYPVLTWGEVLTTVADDYQLTQSIPFVRNLIQENRFLKDSRDSHQTPA